MPIGIGIAIASIAGPAIMNGIVGAVNGRKDEKKARTERRNLEKTLRALEEKRQEFVNPYEGITDLSGNLSNTYANLGVATQAAEIQIEQTDIALANTLDTIRATGGGAGGATALAQAALASKKGVAASIESQEAANEKLRAQGEKQLQQQQMQEGIRLQTADVAGGLFEFNKLETDLDRSQAMVDEQRAREMQGKIDKRAAFSSTMSGLSSSAASLTAAGISSGQIDLGDGV
tara:strand:+ start:2378 stop:3076 length:699 start_codon:yes stop_codon:yes gene_type:complete